MTSLLPGPQRDHYYDEICARWKELSVAATGIVPTKLPLEPFPSDIMLIIDDLVDVLTRNVDPLIEAIARYVQAHSGYRIEPSLMRDQLFKALDGQLLHEIEQAAETVRERMMEGAA